jgi:chromate transporter
VPAGASRDAGLRALFVEFLRVSLMGFGGGLVWARRAVVERRHWMDDAEFADVVGLCQFLPGPNVIGIAVCVGAKLRGATGSLAAIAGFTLIPAAGGLSLAVLFVGLARNPIFHGVLRGVSAAAAGLLIATALRLMRPQRGRPVAWIFAGLAFAGMVVVHLPLFVVLLALLPLSVFTSGDHQEKPR